jgi:hypothetical protein
MLSCMPAQAACRSERAPGGSRSSSAPTRRRKARICVRLSSSGERAIGRKTIREYDRLVTAFETPTDLMHNRGLIPDPEEFARKRGAASWLYLCGEEFASMDGGMSYADVQRAVPESANVVSDPPTPLNMDLARRQIETLDELSRPTLVTCRTGSRSSALIYLYAGLRDGAPAEDVLARAEADHAPWAGSDELRAWVTEGLAELG